MNKNKIFSLIGLIIIGVGLFGVMVKFNNNFSKAIALIGDEPSYMAMADSLIHFRTFNLKQELETKHYRNFFIQNDEVDNGLHIVHLGEKQYPKHGIGWSLFLAPLFLLQDNPRLLGMLVQCFIVALLGINILLWLREQKYNFWLSIFVSMSIIFSVPLIIEANLLFSEPLAALCLVYALRKWDKPNILSAIAIGFLPWIHFKYIAFLPYLIWPFFRINIAKLKNTKIKHWIPLIIACVSIIALTVFNIYAYQSPLSGQEKSSSFFTNFQGLLGIFINRIDGVLPFAPFYILSLLGMGSLLAKKRKEFWHIVFISWVLWLITGVFKDWGGGQSPPARMIMVSLPILAPALVETLIFPIKWFFRTLYLLLFVPSLYIGLYGLWQPIVIINRPAFSHLNKMMNSFGMQIDVEKMFPLAHTLGWNLNLFWLSVFILLFISGFLISKYRKKLENIDESINNYPRIQ